MYLFSLFARKLLLKFHYLLKMVCALFFYKKLQINSNYFNFPNSFRVSKAVSYLLFLATIQCMSLASIINEPVRMTSSRGTPNNTCVNHLIYAIVFKVFQHFFQYCTGTKTLRNYFHFRCIYGTVHSPLRLFACRLAHGHLQSFAIQSSLEFPAFLPDCGDDFSTPTCIVFLRQSHISQSLIDRNLL